MVHLHSNALLASAALYRSTDRVVHVRGDDARSWLNGQITNDVRELAEGEARYALTLTAKGRIVSDLWALGEPDGMAIVLPGEHAEAALARLEHHIIMEDVELQPDDAVELLTVQGPRAREVVARAAPGVLAYGCARLTPGGIDLWVARSDAERTFAALLAAASELGGGALDQAGWADAHVALAVPRMGVDFGEETYPQEAGLGPRALSFGKGCYLGQEVVYMLEKRGQAARRLVQLVLPGGAKVAAGSAVGDTEGKRVGEITSFAHTGEETLALAYVKRPFAEPDQALSVGDLAARVRTVVGVG